METYFDQLVRFRLMASGDPVWDFSDADLAALIAVGNRLDMLETGLVQQQNVVCVWCGLVIERAGRSYEALINDTNSHVLSCEQRPEAKLMQGLTRILAALGLDMAWLLVNDMDALVELIELRTTTLVRLLVEAVEA